MPPSLGETRLLKRIHQVSPEKPLQPHHREERKACQSLLGGQFLIGNILSHERIVKTPRRERSRLAAGRQRKEDRLHHQMLPLGGIPQRRKCRGRYSPSRKQLHATHEGHLPRLHLILHRMIFIHLLPSDPPSAIIYIIWVTRTPETTSTNRIGRPLPGSESRPSSRIK